MMRLEARATMAAYVAARARAQSSVPVRQALHSKLHSQPSQMGKPQTLRGPLKRLHVISTLEKLIGADSLGEWSG